MKEHNNRVSTGHFELVHRKNNNSIWLASTLQLSRNLNKFLFPSKLDVHKKKQLQALMLQAIMPVNIFENVKIIPANEITPIEKELLIEHFLISEGAQEIDPGASFVLDESGSLLLLCNVRDHLHLQYIDIDGNLEESWDRLTKIENALSQTISFAYNEKFGFLTADVTRCGTGLVISAFLHVPALIHLGELQDLLEREISEEIFITGFQGSPDEFIGDIIMIRNMYTLGVSEETIISTIRGAILRIVLAEKNARTRIQEQAHPIVKDIISRSIGVLKFSYNIDAKEALGAISLVKFGLELGWLSGMSISEINGLLFESRRAHLILDLLKGVELDHITERRAEFLRERVKMLTIDFPASL